MGRPSWASSLALLLALVCLWSIFTLVTWPPYVGSTWKLSHPAAWWQSEVFLFIGFLLSALPSFAVFQLDAFFHAHEQLRYPFAALLIAAEVAVLCYAVYRIARSVERGA
jgi:hypothetical protein